MIIALRNGKKIDAANGDGNVGAHLIIKGRIMTNSVSDERDQTTIVPRIKHTQFLASLRAMNIPDDQLPFTEPLVADLLVTYAFDLPGMFQMVTKADLAAMSLMPAQLREIGLNNMRRTHPGISVKEQGPFLQVITGDNLEACSLLAVKFWEQVAQKLPGKLVVAAPSRDVVLFCANPEPALVQVLRELIGEVRGAEPVHCLTESLLTWNSVTWAVYPE
jgi:uncharacterized protein YtpQ (UPF0354 family)